MGSNEDFSEAEFNQPCRYRWQLVSHDFFRRFSRTSLRVASNQLDPAEERPTCFFFGRCCLLVFMFTCFLFFSGSFPSMFSCHKLINYILWQFYWFPNISANSWAIGSTLTDHQPTIPRYCLHPKFDLISVNLCAQISIMVHSSLFMSEQIMGQVPKLC